MEIIDMRRRAEDQVLNIKEQHILIWWPILNGCWMLITTVASRHPCVFYVHRNVSSCQTWMPWARHNWWKYFIE